MFIYNLHVSCNIYWVIQNQRGAERERERERENIYFSSKNLEQIIIAMKGCDIWTVWRSLDASSSMVYAQQDMFMKKLVFNREKFSGSSIVIYASFSHASNLRCSMNIAENYSTCFLMQMIMYTKMISFYKRCK